MGRNGLLVRSRRGRARPFSNVRDARSLALFECLMQTACTQKDVVFVRGARTPFVTSGGEYNDYMAYDLQVHTRTRTPCHPPPVAPFALTSVSLHSKSFGR